MLTNEKKKNSKIFMVQNEMGGVNTYERDFQELQFNNMYTSIANK